MMHLSGKLRITKGKRKVCVKDWLLRRDESNAFHMIMQEVRLQDAESFRKYLGINIAIY